MLVRWKRNRPARVAQLIKQAKIIAFLVQAYNSSVQIDFALAAATPLNALET